MIGRRHGDVNDAGPKGAKRMLSVIREVSVQGKEDLLLFALGSGHNKLLIIQCLRPFSGGKIGNYSFNDRYFAWPDPHQKNRFLRTTGCCGSLRVLPQLGNFLKDINHLCQSDLVIPVNISTG
jgi:hypothetical protein